MYLLLPSHICNLLNKILPFPWFEVIFYAPKDYLWSLSSIRLIVMQCVCKRNRKTKNKQNEKIYQPLKATRRYKSNTNTRILAGYEWEIIRERGGAILPMFSHWLFRIEAMCFCQVIYYSRSIWAILSSCKWGENINIH